MQKNLLRAAKIILSLCLVLVIYHYFFKVQNIALVWEHMRSFPLYLILISTLIAGINWCIEARKWQVLLKQLQALRFYTACKSVFAGAAVSNILPFRIGEYLGRIVYIQEENRIPAIFNSILGSSCQLFVSLVFGIPASLLMLDDSYHNIATYAGATVVLIPVFFFVLFYYFLHTRKFKKNWLNKLSEDIRKFTPAQVLHVLWLSLLRYLIFGSFYVFLLFHFGVVQDMEVAMAGVATVYLLQSFAPSVVLTDAGLRTGLPLLVFKTAPQLQPALLAAALLNYIFNIVLPSILGLGFIISEKIKNK
jgi:hypothetical protein